MQQCECCIDMLERISCSMFEVLLLHPLINGCRPFQNESFSLEAIEAHQVSRQRRPRSSSWNIGEDERWVGSDSSKRTQSLTQFLAAYQNLHRAARISCLTTPNLKKVAQDYYSGGRERESPFVRGERSGNYYSLSAVAGSFAAGHALCCEGGRLTE